MENNHLSIENKELSFANILGYGVGSIGENIAYTVFYNFFLFFLTNLVGLSATLGGIISFVAVLWDAVTDPAIGYISDQTTNPKGRRRPIIFKGSFALGTTIFLMFTDLQFLPMGVKGFYFLLVNMFFWLFLTMSDIPYLALAAELDDTAEGRTKIRSVAAAFLQVGMLIASTAMLPLVNIFGDGNQLRGWSIAGAIMGIIATSSYLISVIATKGLEKENPNIGIEKLDRKTAIKNFMKSTIDMIRFKPYFILLALTFFVWFAANTQQSSLMYFMTYNVGMTDAQMSTQYLIVGIACSILPLVFAPITNKFGKKAIVGWGLAFTGVATVITAFIRPWSLTHLYLFRAFSIFLLTIWYVPIYSMVFDVSDLDELENNVRRDGGMQSMFQFSIKLATAVSIFVIGLLLDLYGYNASAAVQTAKTLNGIKNLTILFPGIMLILAAIFTMIYPINNKLMQENSAALERRKLKE